MTKREVVWLLIRLAGVYFAYLAIITLFTVITSGWSLIFAPPKLDVPNTNSNRAATIPGITQPAPYDINNPSATPATSTAEPEKPEDKAKRGALMSFLGGLFIALIYGGLGFYFLRDGRVLFALLMREDSDKPDKKESEVTSLNL
jgi:hypothetical protein